VRLYHWIICNDGHELGITVDWETLKNMKWSYPCNRSWRPVRLWEVNDPMSSRQSATLHFPGQPSAQAYNLAVLFLRDIRKYGNLVLQVEGVSDETVTYGYGFCLTRPIEWLHCKLQTRPLVSEGALQKQDRNFQTATFRQEVISCRKYQSGLDTKIYWLTDRQS
jgi:hypothetical protein